MLAPTHRAFSVPVTVGCITIASKTGIILSGTMQTQAVSTVLIVAIAWFASTMPDYDRYIPFLRHRGWTHALWILAISLFYSLQLPAGQITTYIVFGVFCGWFSHIVGDSFSVAGNAWLYPFMGYADYDSGAFVVKGFRGIFQPIYRTGAKTFINMKWVWYVIGIAALVLRIMYMLQII